MNIVTKIATAAALTLFAGVANAATLTVVDGDPFGTVHCETCWYLAGDTDTGNDGYNVTSGGTYVGTASWIPATNTVEDLWTVSPNANSEENEVAAYNTITGETLDHNLFWRDNSGTFYDFDDPYASTVDELLIFKFGYGQKGTRTHLFVWNEAGSEIYYTGSRLSHVTVGEIPLPAAGFLLLGGLGGLAVMRRRKKT